MTKANERSNYVNTGRLFGPFQNGRSNSLNKSNDEIAF